MLNPRIQQGRGRTRRGQRFGEGNKPEEVTADLHVGRSWLRPRGQRGVGHMESMEYPQFKVRHEGGRAGAERRARGCRFHPERDRVSLREHKQHICDLKEHYCSNAESLCRLLLSSQREMTGLSQVSGSRDKKRKGTKRCG